MSTLREAAGPDPYREIAGLLSQRGPVLELDHGK
jgi:hypothetical protein